MLDTVSLGYLWFPQFIFPSRSFGKLYREIPHFFTKLLVTKRLSRDGKS